MAFDRRFDRLMVKGKEKDQDEEVAPHVLVLWKSRVHKLFREPGGASV
jgi:hypothetical protein